MRVSFCVKTDGVFLKNFRGIFKNRPKAVEEVY